MENSYNWETYTSSVSGHKIKTQKSVVFLFTNNEFVQKQIKKKRNKSRKNYFIITNNKQNTKE